MLGALAAVGFGRQSWPLPAWPTLVLGGLVLAGLGAGIAAAELPPDRAVAWLIGGAAVGGTVAAASYLFGVRLSRPPAPSDEGAAPTTEDEQHSGTNESAAPPTVLPPTATGAAEPAPGNLPTELTPFIGRERELGELSQLIEESRLISLLGPAGIGKTRLALRLAALMRRRFRDGVWLIELASLSDGGLLPGVIATVLGIPETRAGETLAVLETALASKELLLILDNCEHVADQVAAVLDYLLRTCPGLTVLVTSRERLGVVGELPWRVPPLDVPRTDHVSAPGELKQVDAVALFVDRARRADRRFAIQPANARDVAALLHRLDGIPLAVELAAAWMETLTPGELVHELDQRYQILVARARVFNERHTSLWAAIDSSYQRLDPLARTLFCQLGIFAGGWNLGAMTAVCELESGPAVEVLGRLVDHSLVTVVPTTEGPTRYRLLNVLHHYALSRLERSGQRDATERRLANHLVELAEAASSNLATREGPRWLSILDEEIDNLRAVFAMERPWAREPRLRLAVAMVPYWHFRGLFNEGRRHLGDVLATAGATSPATVAALNGLSLLCWAQGDLPGAIRYARSALRGARGTGHRRGTALALLRLAHARFDAGHPAAARRATERAHEIAAELHDQSLTAECTLQLGEVALVEDRLGDAERLLRESVVLLGRIGQVDREALALQVLGRLYQRQGRTEEAEAALVWSMSALREFGLVRQIVPMLEGLAAMAADRGDHRRAARLAGAAQGLLERMGARPLLTAPQRSAARARRDAVLTGRQLEVARLIARAMSNKDIADRLGLSERTIEGHVQQICNRLGFSSRVQIGVWMAQHEPRR